MNQKVKAICAHALIACFLATGISSSAAKESGDPVSLSIASLGISTTIKPLGLETDGSLSVPIDSKYAGWFTGAPKPGEIGPAIIVAHVDWKGSKGPFYTLKKIKKGALISVKVVGKPDIRFQVTSISYVKKNQFPTNVVYGNIDFPGLRLITCETFDSKSKAYVDNLIVYAKQMSS
jgi:LPXTG-site transpeptidase (sortase) family protein